MSFAPLALVLQGEGSGVRGTSDFPMPVIYPGILTKAAKDKVGVAGCSNAAHSQPLFSPDYQGEGSGFLELFNFLCDR